MIVGILTFILGIAFHEAILKPMIVHWTQKFALDILPDLFNELDPIMPKLISEKSPDDIETFIKCRIFDKSTGLNEDQVNQVLDLFVEKYNFLENAKKLKPTPSEES